MANVTRYKTSKGEARYRVRYRKPDGTQTDKRGFRRKIDAENWAAEHVTIAKATNSYVDPEDGKRRVGDLYEQWLKEKRPFWKETTRVNATEAWRLYCEERWADRRIGAITRAEVQAWISDIIASAGASSVRRPYQTMLGICRMAVRDRLILDNPCENVELPKLPRRKSRRVYLTISRLLAFADECARGKHLGEERRALVLTLGFCGLRWGEAAALKARDLDFGRGVLHVGGNLVYVGARWVEGTPKNSEERDVPMPLIVMEALKPICGEREPDERVFRDLRGGPIMKQSTAKTTGWWYHALVRLGWPKEEWPTPHDLRHTAASLAVHAGRERQGAAADAGPQEREHDVGRVRGSVRQRFDGCCPSARCCGAGGDRYGRDRIPSGEKRFRALSRSCWMVGVQFSRLWTPGWLW